MKKNEFIILVADDDEIARDVVASILGKEGYSVTAARDGHEAISVLGRERVELVITDLRMPGADGFDVLRFALQQDPDRAVVILTAYGTLDTTLEAMDAGAFDYLTKPFKAQEILLLAERAFRRAVLISENRAFRDILRSTYRDLGQAFGNGGPDRDARTAWQGRIETLQQLAALSQEEAADLYERIGTGHGTGAGKNTRR